MQCKILVVDDSSDGIELAATLIRRNVGDVEIMTAETGSAGLELASRELPDLIVLDVCMPQPDGYEVCRRLKADPATADIPILMVSAVSTSAEQRSAGLDCGADGYLCRPCENTEFVLQVRALLKIKSQQDQLRAHQKQLESDLRERTRELEDSEHQLRILFEQSPDAIFVEDLEGNVLDANAAACRLHGTDRCTLIGMNVLDLVPPAEREAVAETFPKWSTNELEMYEGYSYRFDGQSIPVEVRASRIRYADQPALLLHVRDITQRRHMENEIVQAQKLESLGMLAGGIAHDFNNILTGIIGNLSFARMETGSTDVLRETLHEAEKSALRAKTLTNQLLVFSKGGAPVRETASIASLLADASRFVLTGSRSACTTNIAEDLWPIEADVGQISQVVENLVINADQAMPDGGRIRIRAENAVLEKQHPDLRRHMRPGKYVRITVQDEGTGIAEDNLSRVFDPYFTTKKHGSGLGLASTYSIVTRHEGSITVRSEEGYGTTFTVYLPASDETVADVEPVTSHAVEGSGRILLMDDDDMVRSAAGRMLRKLGYTVVCAVNGDEAIRHYAEAYEKGVPFDVVILDLTVPGGMGGEKAMARLKDIDPGVKAIVSSGYSDVPIVANPSAYGFRAAVPKPYDMQKIGQVLARVLES